MPLASALDLALGKILGTELVHNSVNTLFATLLTRFVVTQSSNDFRCSDGSVFEYSVYGPFMGGAGDDSWSRFAACT